MSILTNQESLTIYEILSLFSIIHLKDTILTYEKISALPEKAKKMLIDKRLIDKSTSKKEIIRFLAGAAISSISNTNISLSKLTYDKDFNDIYLFIRRYNQNKYHLTQLFSNLSEIKSQFVNKLFQLFVDNSYIDDSQKATFNNGYKLFKLEGIKRFLIDEKTINYSNKITKINEDALLCDRIKSILDRISNYLPITQEEKDLCIKGEEYFIQIVKKIIHILLNDENTEYLKTSLSKLNVKEKNDFLYENMIDPSKYETLLATFSCSNYQVNRKTLTKRFFAFREDNCLLYCKDDKQDFNYLEYFLYDDSNKELINQYYEETMNSYYKKQAKIKEKEEQKEIEKQKKNEERKKKNAEKQRIYREKRKQEALEEAIRKQKEEKIRQEQERIRQEEQRKIDAQNRIIAQKRAEEERKHQEEQRKIAEQNRLNAEKRAEEERRRLEQERIQKQQAELAKIKEKETLKERYLKLITYTVREYRDCMGYDIARKDKNLAKNQNYLDLLDYIHNKLGIPSHEATEYLDEETGDFIEHKMTSYFTPEKDPELGRLYYEFQKNTLTYNRLLERGDEWNQGILYVKYRSIYRRLVVNISRKLNIDEDSATKLVSENGELYGEVRTDSILYNEDFRNLRQNLKSAKKEYDDYIAADWDGRRAMVPEILKWKLSDVRKKANNVVDKLGYDTACEIFVAACKELKADVSALETLLGFEIKR